jgi:small-conductance mechanosensitive channel
LRFVTYAVAVQRAVRSDDEDREAPPAVVAAVAIGTAPLPIIAVYTVMFLVHGSVHPVQPPDVTSTPGGEFVVGWIALVLFILLALALFWLLNGRRRWPFAVLELGVLALCIDFLVDDTVSGKTVSVLIAVTSMVALVFAFLPPAWVFLGQQTPPRLARVVSWRPSRDRLPLRRRAAELPLHSEQS